MGFDGKAYPSPGIWADTRPSAQPTRVSVAMVEPCSLVHEAIAAMLQCSAPEFDVIPFSSVGRLLAAVSAGDRPHIVMVNIDDTPTEEVTLQGSLDEIRAALGDVAVVLLGTERPLEDIAPAIRQGIAGFVECGMGPVEVAAALRIIAAGYRFVPATSVMRFFDDLSRRDDGPQRNEAPKIRLTEREEAVLERLRAGKPNKLIAHELGVHVSTVKVHLRGIKEKLGAMNRTEAAVLAQRMVHGTMRFPR